MISEEEVYTEIKKAIDEMAQKRIERFLKELEDQVRSLGQLNGRTISARTIDSWISRAGSQASLEIGGFNRVAFAFWKVLIQAGAKITDQDFCQIVPVPEMQEKLRHSIEERLARNLGISR
jgi:hypothetical protein